MRDTPPSSDRLTLGTLVGCHGVRGWLKVKTASQNPDWAETLETVTLQKTGLPEKTYPIALSQSRGAYQLLLKLQGIESRNDAEPWVGAHLKATLSDLPPLKPGEYRATDLVGLSVIDHQSGALLGTVQEVLSTTGASAGEFLEIKPTHDGPTVLAPLQAHFMPVINPEAGHIRLQGLDALFEAPSLHSSGTPDNTDPV